MASKQSSLEALPYQGPPDRSIMENEIQTNYIAMKHTHYLGMSGPALRTAIGLTAGLCFM